MDSQFAILPAALGMMLGPQILSSIFLATSERSRPNSWAYVAGIALGATLGMAVAYFVATLYEVATDDSEQASDLLIYVIVALLAGPPIRGVDAADLLGVSAQRVPQLADRMRELIAWATPSGGVWMPQTVAVQRLERAIG